MASRELGADELAAWRGMLRITHRTRTALGVELTRRHGLSMADYDALVVLAAQPGREMRMAALADAILQPRSSLTRIVTSLEERGLLERRSTPEDARGASARLTRAGLRLYASAHRTQLQGIRAHFLDHLTERQIGQLARAWASIDPSAV